MTPRSAAPQRAGSTRWAILGALTLGPMSGYDIRRHASEAWGHFWSESYGQIYPALRALEAEGLVRSEPGGAPTNTAARAGGARAAARRAVAPASGRERNGFAITKRGRDALRRWQAEPSAIRPPRNELLLKLFFGANADPAALAAELARLRAREEQALARWGDVERALRHEHAANPHLPYWLAALSFGRHHSGAIVRWCDETLAALPRASRPRSAKTARSARAPRPVHDVRPAHTASSARAPRPARASRPAAGSRSRRAAGTR